MLNVRAIGKAGICEENYSHLIMLGPSRVLVMLGNSSLDGVIIIIFSVMGQGCGVLLMRVKIVFIIPSF